MFFFPALRGEGQGDPALERAAATPRAASGLGGPASLLLLEGLGVAFADLPVHVLRLLVPQAAVLR